MFQLPSIYLGTSRLLSLPSQFCCGHVCYTALTSPNKCILVACAKSNYKLSIKTTIMRQLCPGNKLNTLSINFLGIESILLGKENFSCITRFVSNFSACNLGEPVSLSISLCTPEAVVRFSVQAQWYVVLTQSYTSWNSWELQVHAYIIRRHGQVCLHVRLLNQLRPGMQWLGTSGELMEILYSGTQQTLRCYKQYNCV